MYMGLLCKVLEDRVSQPASSQIITYFVCAADDLRFCPLTVTIQDSEEQSDFVMCMSDHLSQQHFGIWLVGGQDMYK